MKHTRTLTAILAVALMLVASVALTASAQDSAKAVTGKPVPDSVKAMLQQNETAPTEAQKGTMGEQETPAAGKDEMMETETTPAAKGEEMKEDMTPAAEGAKAKAEEKMEGEAKSMTTPEEQPKQAAEPEDPKAPYKNIQFAKGEKPVVVMETSMGTIMLELWPDIAPKHCQSFVYLINKGYFDSLSFHRIVPGFVIQGGDPIGNGTGGPGYNVPAEFSNKLHEDGILSMARRGDDVNSAGSQFFICLGRLPSLDKLYTVFGKVTEGLEVVHKIEKVPVQRERPTEPVYMTKVYMKESK